MKPRPKPKPRPEILISALILILLHLSCGLCRHLHDHHNIRSDDSYPSSLSPHSNDLKQSLIMRLPDETHLAGRSESSGVPRSDGRDLSGVDASFANNDVGGPSKRDHYVFENSVLSPEEYDVTDASLLAGYNRTQESPVMDERQVWSLNDEVVAKRNRIRRQSSSVSSVPRRRKHKRRHRLLLKSRNSHSAGSQDRKNFILKSDSESHVITSANKVKKDWCRTVPFTQKVTAPRCKAKTINNNFCYGQCNSFFIPQQRTSRGVAFQSYSNCMPDRLRWTNVTLECPDQSPPVAIKTVLLVESCRCIAMDEPSGEQVSKHIRHFTRGSRRKMPKMHSE